MVNFAEFRKNTSRYFSDVEQGETLLTIRYGCIVAEIPPRKGKVKNALLETG